MKVPFNIEFSLKRSIRAIATAVCAVVLTSGAAFAQDGAGETESKLMVGFKSGFNLADMRAGGDTDYFSRQHGNGKNFSPQIHVFGRYNFTKWVGAELELGWVQNAFTTYTTTQTTVIVLLLLNGPARAESAGSRTFPTLSSNEEGL